MKQQGAFSMEYMEFAESSLESLKEYGHFVEHNIQQRVEKYDELAKKHNAGEFLNRGKEQYSIDFSNIMRTAWLMSIYALAETVLKEVCNAHAEIQSNKKLKENPKSGMIFETERYLKKQDPEHFSILEYEYKETLEGQEDPNYYDQPMLKYNKMFDFLDTARLIRNKFAHAGGIAADGKKKRKIQKCNEVTIRTDNQIVLSEKYCYKLLENLQHLLYGLKLWVYGVIT